MDKDERGVSRVRSTRKRKGRIQSIKKLHPQYVVGFIDGEGSFSVSIYDDKTMRNKTYVRPEFSIELRADDREILERIQKTLKCGKIFNCSYERYGWYPHVKYKIGRLNELNNILFPFIRKWPLQAKKAKVFPFFKQVVQMMIRKEHLTRNGLRKIVKLQEKIRALGKNIDWKPLGYGKTVRPVVWDDELIDPDTAHHVREAGSGRNPALSKSSKTVKNLIKLIGCHKQIVEIKV